MILEIYFLENILATTPLDYDTNVVEPRFTGVT